MKTHQKKIAGVIATIIIALCTWGYDEFLSMEKPAVEQVVSTKLDTSKIWSRGRGMNAANNATNHFKKHGKEFGFKTEEEYVAAAVAFTSHPPPEVMQNRQSDGDFAFYNPQTAEYAVKSKRGFIRTYFKLNPYIHGYDSNTEYFNAQATRESKRPANDNQMRKNP